MMRVGAVQMNVVKKDKESNIKSVRDWIKKCPMDLVVLPEMFSTGYGFESREELMEVAEIIPNGETTDKLTQMAIENDCYIVGSIIEMEQEHFYITAIVVGPNGYIGKQRKRHLNTDERKLYSPGTESNVFEILGCKVGVVICFEGWFPESVRELTMKGAQIICHSALIVSEKTLDIMRVRAMENKAFVIVANSMGAEFYKNQVVIFRGDSRVIDYNGDVLVQAGSDEKAIRAEIDEKETAHKDLEGCEDLLQEIRVHTLICPLTE